MIVISGLGDRSKARGVGKWPILSSSNILLWSPLISFYPPDKAIKATRKSFWSSSCYHSLISVSTSFSNASSMLYSTQYDGSWSCRILLSREHLRGQNLVFLSVFSGQVDHNSLSVK